MKNLLIEELEKFREHTNYDTKLTLTENKDKILNEFRVNNATRDAVATAVGKNFDDFVRTMKITSRSADDVAVLVAKSADEFDKLFIKAVQKDLSNGFPKGTLGPVAKEMSKIDVLRQLAGKSLAKTGKNKKLTAKEINDIIEQTSSANKLKVSQYAPKPPRNTKVKPVDPKIIEDTVVKYPYLKNLNWKDLLKKGGVLALSTAVLYGIYKLTHDDEPPLPPDPNPDPTPTPGKCPAVTNTGVSYDYQYPGDTKYVYGIKNKEWYAKNVSTGKEFNISKCYPDMINKLTTGATKINTPTPTPTPAPSPSPDDTIDNSQDLVSDEGI